MSKKLMAITTLSLLLLVMVGCTTSTIDSGSSITGDEGSGSLVMYLADKPVNDVEKVIVTLSEVRVHKEDGEDEGWQTINNFENEEDGKAEFDLLKLRFTEDLLGNKELPAGTYDKIRLMVAAADSEVTTQNKKMSDSYVVYKDGTTAPIFIPGGVQAGLQIDYPFVIENNGITELVLDADVSKIMHETGSVKIKLRRTAISVAEKANSGDIVGRVVADLDGDGTAAEVITEYDLDGDGEPESVDVLVKAYPEGADETTEPSATTVASTEMDEETGTEAGSFKLRGLEPGNYNIKVSVVDGEGNQVTNPETGEIIYTQQEVPTIETAVDETVQLDSEIIMEENQVQ